MGQEDYAFSLKMRDTIIRISETVVNRLRPVDRYGVVNTIDTVNRKATVTLTGDPNPTTVSFGAVQPGVVGQIVRVGGTSADRFIKDVLGTPGFAGTPLSPGGIYIRIANGKTASAAPSTWPEGTSVGSVTTANGWPVNGVVLTNRYEGGNYTTQTLVSQGNSQTYVRASSDNVNWLSWLQHMDLNVSQTINSATKTFDSSSRVIIQNNTQVTLGTAGGFQVGSDGGAHMAFSSNVIQARSASTAVDLYLQWYGGDINLGSAAGTVNAQGTVNLGATNKTTSILGAVSLATMKVGDDTIDITTANTDTSFTVTGLGLLSGPTYRAVVAARTATPSNCTIGQVTVSNSSFIAWGSRPSGTSDINFSWIVAAEGI